MPNIKLNEGFDQVCVWPGTVVMPNEIDKFTEFFATEMGTRVQFLESINTEPDRNAAGKPIKGTGGRTDVFFAVHNVDIGKFALPRLKIGVRWLEDMFGNGYGDLYPARVVDYMCWDGYKEEYRSKVTC